MRTDRLFKILVVIVVLGVAVAGLAACAKKATPTAPPPYEAKPSPTPEPTTPPPPTPTPVPTKPVIVLALDSDIDHIELMEFRSDAGYYATANLYEPMLQQKLVPDADGTVLEGQQEYVPGLAESFAIAPDGKSITLKIRQGAKFADGAEITAESFKHTFDRALTSPRSYIPLLTQFMGFSKAEDVVVVDKYTLRINLQQQGALLIPQLAFQVFGAMDPATTKAHATAEDPWAHDWYRKNANPSGPYILTKWEPGVEYVFEPNPNYWQGPDFFQNSKVIAKVVPSPEDRELLLKKGDIDLALGLPFKDIDALKADPNVKVKAIHYTRLFYLGMNNKIPPFDNVKVRQAISYGIPYQTILDKVLYGYGQRAYSPIPKGMPLHNPSFWNYETDTAKTAQLLKEAGVSNLKLELSVRQSIPWDVDAAVWIQASLAEAGVDVTVNRMTDADFFDKLNKHELPFFIHDWYSWGNDPAFQLTFLLKCGAFTNYADYCNPRVDELIEQATWTVDQAARQKMLDEAQQIIVSEAPWAYLHQPDWIVAMNKDFYGFAKLDDLCLRFAYMGKK
ncbi:MAG: ABC transporter substrate-binding protein [Chloroflexi bacterium]|nr:ABC transporter substrate-binding protein [Chloroflexota bacterium]